jgi:2,4-dienoyl-CoA reductase-like NADH-dependent reductase (Old Yellow Enzyme family)
MLELIRERYRGTLIIAGGFDHDTAGSWLQQGKADLIALGRKFLANPDLPERFRSGASLNARFVSGCRNSSMSRDGEHLPSDWRSYAQMPRP